MKKLLQRPLNHRPEKANKMKAEEIAKELIKYKTTSPVRDPGVFQFLKGILEEHGVKTEIHEINGVYNLTAETGTGDISVCLNGHLDVVEPEGQWSVTDPFDPVIEDETLYGRGATDMKGEVAAQVKAFLDLHIDSEFEGRAVLMLSGDEEKGGFNGSKTMVDRFYEKDKGFDYAVVGEPTDLDIQVGVRGVLWLNIILEGEGIHASRAHLAEINVMEVLPKVLEKANNLEMEYENNGSLPDPSHEVTKIESTDTYNSVPGELTLGMDIRYLPSQETDQIVETVEEALKDIKCGVKVEVEHDHGGAFELEDEKLRDVAVDVMSKIRDEKPQEITDGGSSDGRFFSEKGTPFIELGLNQISVHGENEYCDLDKMRELRKAYADICRRLVKS